MAKSESNRTREPDGKGSAGSTEADVVDQHRELDESQNRQEESVISLQQQIEQQREETAELRALLESRLENSRGEAEAGPGGEILARMGSVERQVESIGADSRVDALMLRIGELERKLSAGTSEPLLNEIAHRLDVLEQGGGLEKPETSLASWSRSSRNWKPRCAYCLRPIRGWTTWCLG